jgi:hypothetical protein
MRLLIPISSFILCWSYVYVDCVWCTPHSTAVAAGVHCCYGGATVASAPALTQLRLLELAVFAGHRSDPLLLLLLCHQAQPPPEVWLSVLLSHAEEQLEEMAPQHLAMMLIGLAKMQVRVACCWQFATFVAVCCCCVERWRHST